MQILGRLITHIKTVMARPTIGSKEAGHPSLPQSVGKLDPPVKPGDTIRKYEPSENRVTTINHECIA